MRGIESRSSGSLRSFSTNPLKRAGLAWAAVVGFFGWLVSSNLDEFTGDPKGIAFLAGLAWFLVIPAFTNRQRVEINEDEIRVRTGSKTQTMQTADIQAVAFYQQRSRRSIGNPVMRRNRRDHVVLVGRGKNVKNIDRRNRYYTSSEAVTTLQTMARLVQIASDSGEEGVQAMARGLVEDDVTDELFAMCDQDESVGVIVVGLRGIPDVVGELFSSLAPANEAVSHGWLQR